MTFQREIPALLALIALGACFNADDGSDEIGATETAGTTESTESSDTTTESTSESATDSTSETDTTTGADPFVFASDPPESYARVDRMGMPAVATVLITSKDEYNASSTDAPDLQFSFEANDAIIALHAALNDDLVALGLDACSNYPCYLQTLGLIIPDTLKLDFATPPGFPNGRRLSDRAIDLTLAVLMLDLDVHPVTTFAEIPLNPPQNDVVFSPAFPFLAQPH